MKTATHVETSAKKQGKKKMHGLTKTKVLIAAFMALVITLSVSTFASNGKDEMARADSFHRPSSSQQNNAYVLHINTYLDSDGTPNVNQTYQPDTAVPRPGRLGGVSFDITCTHKDPGSKAKEVSISGVVTTLDNPSDGQNGTTYLTIKNKKKWNKEMISCTISNPRKAGYNLFSSSPAVGIKFPVYLKNPDSDDPYDNDGNAKTIRIEMAKPAAKK